MKIALRHMYHGAALTQIAESPPFTSINWINLPKRRYRSAFRVNDKIGLYLKYAGDPNPPYDEYKFDFSKENKDDLRKLDKECSKTFIALICIEGEQICCISYCAFINLLQRRTRALGTDEDESDILVTLRKGRGFRVYVNSPGTRGKYLGKAIEVPRKAFPKMLFE